MEETALIALTTAVVIAVRFYFERSPVESLAAYFLTVLAFGPLSNMWARARGIEMVEQPEALSRYFHELAAQPAWQVVVNRALLVVHIEGSAAVCLAPVEYWPTVIPAVGAIALPLGILFGIWTVSFSRRVVRVTAERDGGGAAASAHPMPAMETWGRHYFGYVTGLACGLGASTVFDVPWMAAIALAASFLLAKIVANEILPGPIVLTGVTTPFRALPLLRLFVTGVLWWGIPFGVVAVLVAATALPDMPLEADAAVFAGISAAGGLMLVVIAMTLRVTSWTPGANSAR